MTLDIRFFFKVDCNTIRVGIWFICIDGACVFKIVLQYGGSVFLCVLKCVSKGKLAFSS